MARSDRYTGLTDKPIFYADFTNNLDLNPLTGYLAKISNENAVKNSVKNLVFTGNGERFFDSTIGSKLATLLFDPIDPVTAELVRTTIEETLDNHEPRARIVNIVVEPNAENNAYYVKIIFKIINIPEDITLNFILNRAR